MMNSILITKEKEILIKGEGRVRQHIKKMFSLRSLYNPLSLTLFIHFVSVIYVLSNEWVPHAKKMQERNFLHT